MSICNHLTLFIFYVRCSAQTCREAHHTQAQILMRCTVQLASSESRSNCTVASTVHRAVNSAVMISPAVCFLASQTHLVLQQFLSQSKSHVLADLLRVNLLPAWVPASRSFSFVFHNPATFQNVK